MIISSGIIVQVSILNECQKHIEFTAIPKYTKHTPTSETLHSAVNFSSFLILQHGVITYTADT